MTDHTLYTNEGLTAIMLDNEAIALYTENTHCLTMTVEEWHNINMALEGVKK